MMPSSTRFPHLGGSAFNAPLNSSLTTTALPLMAFDPQLRAPYSINWNVSLQQSLGYPNVITPLTSVRLVTDYCTQKLSLTRIHSSHS